MGKLYEQFRNVRATGVVEEGKVSQRGGGKSALAFV